MTDPTPDTPTPDAPTPNPDTPPAPPTHTAPADTGDNDVHRSLAAITQTLAELQNTVAGLVADGQPVKATDPSPKRKPWTHRGTK